MLRKSGVNCVILDKANFPRQKPCAGWITPEVFKALQISPEEYPKSLTRFSSFQVSLFGFSFRFPTKQYAVRRWEFDTWLLERSDIEIIKHQVDHITRQDDLFIIDGAYSGKVLVGAGGTHCPVQRTFFDRQFSSRKSGLIIAREEEFTYSIVDDRCHLWFFENGFPGYSWYVPKTGGYINVGIGGNSKKLKARGETLKQYWDRLVAKLSESGLVNDHEYNPLGYTYFLRQQSKKADLENVYLAGDALGLATRDMGEGIRPAIMSGLLAAKAIIAREKYTLESIPKFSFPSLLRQRK